MRSLKRFDGRVPACVYFPGAAMRLDDNILEHPKVAAVSETGQLTFLRCIAYANRHLTDGHIPEAMAPAMAPRNTVAVFAELVGTIPRGFSVGLLEVVEAGWQIHDYLLHNPSRESVLARRRSDAARQKRSRRSAGAATDSTARSESRRDSADLTNRSDQTNRDHRSDSDTGSRTGSGRSRTRNGGTPIPSNWAPNENHAALASRCNVTPEEVVELEKAMRGWAERGQRTSTNWDGVFAKFIENRSQRQANQPKQGSFIAAASHDQPAWMKDLRERDPEKAKAAGI